jgi:hypothetical protein
MYDMVGIESAFAVEMFLWVFALVNVIEESIVGHNMGRIEWTSHAFLRLTHRFYYNQKLLVIIKTLQSISKCNYRV